MAYRDLMIKARHRIFCVFCIFFAVCFPAAAQVLQAVRSVEGIEIREKGTPILFYQTKAKSLEGKFEKANYVHPLYSLDGQVLTEDFPADHPHHHGIFWAWHQILHHGVEIGDVWTSKNISWEVTQTKIRERSASVTLHNEVVWKATLPGKGELAMVDEKATITVYASMHDYRVIDFEILLKARVDGLEIGGPSDPKGYGGFSWRINLPADIRFLNKDTVVQAQTLAVEAGPWLDFYGSLEGPDKETSGIAVFSHPSNPGHPQPWILRREKSMQNLAYPGKDPVVLPRSGLRLQYRIVIHSNHIDLEALEKLYRAYK